MGSATRGSRVGLVMCHCTSFLLVVTSMLGRSNRAKGTVDLIGRMLRETQRSNASGTICPGS